jgi:cardiolipin synthase A/B
MIRKQRSTRRKVFIVVTTVLLTLVAVIAAANFSEAEKSVERRLERLYSVRDSAFIRAMGIALGPSVVGGNRVGTLLNGDQIFPAMLGAIKAATRTVTMETYIYWGGEVGRQFAEALAERARAGVKVHVLVDWAGSSKMDDAYVTLMQDAGVEFRKYRPLRWYNLSRINNRTHRKLLVTDGRIGFTGGVGIGDVWAGHGQDPEHWRDSHFRIEGPAVAQMQAAFMDNWIEATGEVLHGPDYFPALDSVGTQPAQVFSSSPSGGSESMKLMYLLAITAAERSIDLSSAYFIPDRLTEDALVAALKRGVRVRIIVPGEYIDTKIARGASRARWGDLLAAGAEIFEYQPTMYHVKVLVVDTLLVSVGSTNFDPRSFGLNDEANLNIYDTGFAVLQLAIFDQDLARARRVTHEAWRARPWREKLTERLASLLGPAL